jgi:hypothetical protein
MQEILPGLYYWSAFHEPIGTNVSSYYFRDAGIVIDPKVPDGGLDTLPGRPQQIVMTIGLHDRDVQAFADTFGIPIRASHEAAQRLQGSLGVEPFGDGEQVAPGVTAHAVDAIAPDEYALHLDVAEGALAFADGLTNSRGLGFVPDGLLGDDPQGVKRGLLDAFGRLLALDFDHLLFAHGEPLIGGGKAALREFVQAAQSR